MKNPATVTDMIERDFARLSREIAEPRAVDVHGRYRDPDAVKRLARKLRSYSELMIRELDAVAWPEPKTKETT